MSKRFSSKDLEAAMGKTKADPNQGFKHGGGDGEEKTFCRTEPLGTLKPKANAKGKGKKGKNGAGYENKFTDDGKTASKYSVKTNEQEAKLVSTVGPRVKRKTEEVELVEIECAGCGNVFEENPAFLSESGYYRCSGCCKPSKAQRSKKKRQF